MKMPHIYKGFKIMVRKANSGTYWLDITLNGTTVRSYKPPMQVIYIGDSRGLIAYDHDVQHCEKLIDRIEKKLSFNPSKSST